VMRWLGGVASQEQLDAALDRLEAYASEFGHTFWAVERKSDGALLGCCGLKRLNSPGGEHLHGAFEIGWRLREDAWGQGLASEAAAASLYLGFDQFGAKTIVAMTVPGNVASQKVMQRLGMKRLPHLDFVDRRFAHPGDWNPSIVTAISAADWKAQR